MRFDEHFIKDVLPDVSIDYGNVPENVNFVIDSRVAASGDIFIALPGARVDGHEFVVEAITNGAAGVMIARDKVSILDSLGARELKKLCIILVKDTLSSLISLARAWRNQFTCPIIAITGSVGKTSTKGTLANILKEHGSKHVVSEGTQNTKIGISINILRMKSDTEVGVFEVGVNRRGEMAKLADLLRPTTAVITSVGHSHMEGLGSLQDIALEKRDIFKCFSDDSIGIVNGDQPILANVSYPHPVIKFGLKTTNQIQARKLRVAGSHISFVLKIYHEKYPMVLEHPHAGVVSNILAATAVAHQLGIPHETIVKAVQMPIVIAGRFEEKPIKKHPGVIISDCFNANPESMKAALLAFQQIETKAKKVAVLGDMLELGVNSPFWHRQIGRFLRKVPSLKRLILVGSLVKWTKKTVPVGVKVDVVPSWREAADKLEDELKQESVVLVKGSRGMALDNIVSSFTE